MINFIKRFYAMIYIQVDYRRIKITDYLYYRKSVKKAIRKFYAYKKIDYYQSMCWQAELICEDLCDMERINQKLTKIFISIHYKKLEDPMIGFYSGEYDLLNNFEG